MRGMVVACVAVLALGLGAVETSSAGWPCWSSCAPAPVQCQSQTITCYRPEYRTEWREVERTVYRCVPEVKEQEIKETVMVPNFREEERQQTVWVPETRQETRQRTVVRT